MSNQTMTTTTPSGPRMSIAERVKFLFTVFPQQVRQEVAKVTWPSRKETLVTAAMVFAMSIAAAIFFVVVDTVLSRVMALILGFGG
jgi:preprotein translocase subunit SecE